MAKVCLEVRIDSVILLTFFLYSFCILSVCFLCSFCTLFVSTFADLVTGVGNQVSVEFNLLYRFHSCISRKDERWINDFFLKLFPGRNADDLQDISMPELGQALLRFDQSLPTDPSERTFDGLERQENGKFKDEDLVRILKEAMDDPAGTFGSKMVPKALKIIEIQGINQARRWGCASLNEFREFFGLKRYESFKDINSDEYIAYALEKLYTDPDMVELYPGMMIEDIKPIKKPGVGISPTYSELFSPRYGNMEANNR